IGARALRRTQRGEFFKRDRERLGQDSPTSARPAGGRPASPDAGFLAVALAEVESILHEGDGELQAGNLPDGWEEGLPAALEGLFKALPRLRTWNALDGWRHGDTAGNPFPSAYLLCLLLLSRLPDEAWALPDAVEEWVALHHPYWASADVRPSRQRDWASPFLLGLAYPLRLVQAARTADGAWAVRLSPLGRWLLHVDDAPLGNVSYPKTLLVQPNLEVVAYRQGLTPGLIARLTRFAAWKSLRSACTLQPRPETGYRALEGGRALSNILR